MKGTAPPNERSTYVTPLPNLASAGYASQPSGRDISDDDCIPRLFGRQQTGAGLSPGALRNRGLVQDPGRGAEGWGRCCRPGSCVGGLRTPFDYRTRPASASGRGTTDGAGCRGISVCQSSPTAGANAFRRRCAEDTAERSPRRPSKRPGLAGR